MKQNLPNSTSRAKRLGRFLEGAAAVGFIALIGLSIASLGLGPGRSWAAVFLDQGSALGGRGRFASASKESGPYDGLGGKALLGRASQASGCLNGMGMTVESEVIDKSLRDILAEAEKQSGAQRLTEDSGNYWAEALSGFGHVEGEGWAIITRRESTANDGEMAKEEMESLFAEDGASSSALAVARVHQQLDAVRAGSGTFREGRTVVEIVAANDPQGGAPCRVMRYRPKSSASGWRALGAPTAASPEWTEIQGWMSPMKVLLGWEMADEDHGIPNGLAACLVESGPESAPRAQEVASRLQANGFRAQVHLLKDNASTTIIDAEDPQGRRVMAILRETPGQPASWILTLTQEGQ